MYPTLALVEEKFGAFNALCFEGKLPQPVLKLSHAKTYLGRLTFKKKFSGFWHRKVELYDFVLRISACYDLPEAVFEDTLIHEMIHYEIALGQQQDRSAHGPLFRNRMKEINDRFGRHIRISYRLEAVGKPHPLM